MHLHIKYTWLFSCSVMPNFLPSHGLQHSRLPCPSPSPRVCSNSGPLSQWCYLIISSSATLFSFCLLSFPASGFFPMSSLHQVAKYWSISFSISASNGYSGSVSFRINWFDLLAGDRGCTCPHIFCRLSFVFSCVCSSRATFVTLSAAHSPSCDPRRASDLNRPVQTWLGWIASLSRLPFVTSHLFLTSCGLRYSFKPAAQHWVLGSAEDKASASGSHHCQRLCL